MKRVNNYKKRVFRPNINEALAILISSTKRKKRLVSLVDVSRWLDIAVNKLGGYEEVADRLGLSTKMLRQFSLVARFHPKVKVFFERRAIDSIDAVVHLLMLSNTEQVIVAKLLAKKKIDTTDLRAIVQIRKSNAKIPIRNIIDEVIKSKTKKHYVVEFIIREGDNYKELMKQFKKHISTNNIIRLDIEGSFGGLVLTKDGKQELYQTAKKLNTRFQYVIPAILSR